MTISSHHESAPEWIVFCPRCGSKMVTKQIGDKSRRACPQCHYIYFTDPKVGVGVLIVEDGRILLVKRAMNPEKGKWSIPAGFLDYGEDPQLTAVRETKEETGLEIETTGLVNVYYNSSASSKGGASIFILYSARSIGGVLKAGDDAEEAAFFDREELPELAFQSTYDAIERWQFLDSALT